VKRLPVIAIAAVVLAALVTSCGVAKDDTAATVNGHRISMAEVSKLAKTTFAAQRADSAGTGLVSSPKGTTGAATQRFALSLLVQVQIYEDGISKRKGSISAADRDSAEEQLTKAETDNGTKFEPVVRDFFSRYIAAQEALGRLLGSADIESAATPDKVAAYFDEHRDEFVKICLDGFAVAPGNEAAAQAAVDRGDAVPTILADAALGAQPLSQDGSETCVLSSQVTNPDLAKAIVSGPIGSWSTSTVAAQTGGSSYVVFVRSNSRDQLTADDPDVSAQITKALQDAATQASQEKVSSEAGAIFGAADVDLNSQFGTWDPKSDTLVVAPATPKASATATTTTTPAFTGQ